MVRWKSNESVEMKMNLPVWPCQLSPFYPPHYYSYPANTHGMINTSMHTSLNSSSGYESGSHETSFVDPCFSSPLSVVKESNVNFIPHVNENRKRSLEDSEIDEDNVENDNDYGRKKRRVLSRPQRQEANRRERQRMDIINEAYEQLRNVLPFKKGRKRQKMSRMDTVDGAIRYIHSLLEILHGPNYDPSWAQ